MKSVLLILMVVFAIPVYGTGLKSVTDTKLLSDEMVDNFVNKKFKEGIDKAKLHWPLPPVEMDNLLNIINQQWPIVDQRFGPAVGKEFLYSETIGDSFVRHYYLHKFKNHSIYWKITFYKPESFWKVNGVEFLDNLDVLYRK